MTDLREIQHFELKILKDVVKVCDSNDIQYFIDAGTLLGAVRHKGFIPWDDDIDICMTLPNYRKFLNIAQKELGKKYFVQNYKTEKNYCEMWTQIRTNGTTSMPINLKNYSIHFGMCIDIFPLVGIHDNLKKRKKQERALALNRTLLSDKYLLALNEKFTFKQKILYLIPRCIRRKICSINERRFMLNPDFFSNCARVWYKLENEYPAKLFKNYMKIQFEDDEFYSISDYDQYLTIMFGDYMQLPPENERGGHSDSLGKIIFDIHNDYSTYK